MLRVDTDERRQVEALQVGAVLPSDGLSDRAHRDRATGVQENLVDLLHVCLIFNEADIVVHRLFVTEKFLGSLQGDFGVLDPVLARELEQLFRRDGLDQVDCHNVAWMVEKA